MDESDADFVPQVIRDHYEICEWRHALPILATAYKEQWNDIVDVLTNFRLLKSEIIEEGKNKSPITKRLDVAFLNKDWKEREYETKLTVEIFPKRSRRNYRPRIPRLPIATANHHAQTHLIDCLKGRVGLEIEWNSKDQTFARDLSNFRALFDIRVLAVGIIVTRAETLQRLFNELGPEIGGKYGASTTHMGHLRRRIEGGLAGGCPVLGLGITRSLYVDDLSQA